MLDYIRVYFFGNTLSAGITVVTTVVAGAFVYLVWRAFVPKNTEGRRRRDVLSWWEWSKRRHCPHSSLRGIYGDEITVTPGYRRLVCTRCETFLDGPVSLARERSNT